LNGREKSKSMVVSELIDYIIEQINYESYLKEDATQDEYQARIDNIKELKNVACTYNDMEPKESLAQFLEEVALITDIESVDTESDFVTLMTIHTSK
jgi:DNA helicase-2/ATP-dependent DNA helicase PcrA